MKIERVEIRNFQGLKDFALTLREPLTIIAGPNRIGKSSIRDAIELAITGIPKRVSQKKELRELIHEGAKSGKVLVHFDGGRMAGFTLPAGDHVETVLEGAMPERWAIALDAQRFAALKPDDRRTFLFDAMGVSADSKAIVARLVALGCDAERVVKIEPMLRAGFDAAQKNAADAARLAKGEWRGITGETYGGVKATDWQPAGATWDDGLALDLQSANADLEEWNAKHVDYKARSRSWEGERQRYETAVADRNTLQARADVLSTATDNVKRAKQELDDYRPKVEALREHARPKRTTWPCPACGTVLAYEKPHDRMVVYETDAPHDPEAAGRLAEHEAGLKVLENALSSRQRALGAAEEASLALTTFKLPEPPGDAPGAAEWKRIEDGMAQATARRDGLVQRKNLATAAATKKKEADRAHADVMAWLKIADFLAPDGLPSTLLAEAVVPLNKHAATLARAARNADGSHWEVPVITPDIGIQAGARDYRLLSESEKWRVDAVLAVAFALALKTSIVMLDRWDVLDTPSRGQAVRMLLHSIKTAAIESALLFGTLKEAPKPFAGASIVWLPTHGSATVAPALAEQA